jgi:hypothetical protein
MLSRIVELSLAQLAAIQEGNARRMTVLDADMKKAIREKNTAVEAWRRHVQEHGC